MYDATGNIVKLFLLSAEIWRKNNECRREERKKEGERWLSRKRETMQIRARHLYGISAKFELCAGLENRHNCLFRTLEIAKV